MSRGPKYPEYKVGDKVRLLIGHGRKYISHPAGMLMLVEKLGHKPDAMVLKDPTGVRPLLKGVRRADIKLLEI